MILTIEARIADGLLDPTGLDDTLAGLTLLAAFATVCILVGWTCSLIGQGPNLQNDSNSINSSKLKIVSKTHTKKILQIKFNVLPQAKQCFILCNKRTSNKLSLTPLAEKAIMLEKSPSISQERALERKEK